MLNAMFENGRTFSQTSVRACDRWSFYPRKVTVSATSMTKRQLALKSHVRHEEFVHELQPIITLWMTYGLFKAFVLDLTINEGSQDPQIRFEKVRVAVGVLKELVDRLEALLEKWPNAVWMFYPETGHLGRLHLCSEFYTEIYPFCFPDAPQEVSWRATRRVRGHRWCGIAQRTRKEVHRAFRLWDLFKAGSRPMEIAQREFPSKSSRRTRTWKKELMVVLRSLDRASHLIYGQPLPKKRKMRRLLDFNSSEHLATCAQCRSATTLEQLCAPARDFANQDQQYQRELPLSDEIRQNGRHPQEF